MGCRHLNARLASSHPDQPLIRKDSATPEMITAAIKKMNCLSVKGVSC